MKFDNSLRINPLVFWNYEPKHARHDNGIPSHVQGTRLGNPNRAPQLNSHDEPSLGKYDQRI